MTARRPATRKASRLGVRALAFSAIGGVAAAALGATFLQPDSSRAPANAPAPKYYGVNLASAEFAPEKLPGVHGRDYIYPTRAIAEPFRAMGMNTVRLPVLWERLQPQPMGPLDEAEVRRLDAAIGDLDGFKSVIIDLHNYGRFRGVALDRTARPGGAMLADLWTRLANRYKGNSRVAFGVMNEPHDMDAVAWRRIADQTVDAIRRTGANNLLLVPGVNWTGGHSWHQGGQNSNAATLSGFVDPGRNFVFEIHQYLDSNSSGTGKDCVGGAAGRQRLAGVTRWLRQERAQAVLAEFGVPPTPTCLAALDDLLAYLRENGDVWVGWTYWAGGDWWGDYPFSIQPQGGRARAQSDILKRHIASYRN